MRIGVYLPLSGVEAALGVDTRDGIDLAMERAVDSDGVRGRSIEPIYADDHSRIEDVVPTILGFLKEPSIVAILGDVTSARSRVGGIIANKSHIPLLTPSSTNPDVTRIGSFVFRACFDDDAQAGAAARYLIQERHRKTIGVLWADDDTYSRTLARAFREEAQRLGAAVVERSFSWRDTDFKDDLTALRKQHPDVIYVPVYYHVMPAIIRDAKPLGFSGRDFFGGDGWHSDTLLERAGADLAGAELTTPWLIDVPSAESRAFVDAYRARYHRDPSGLSALGYDAASLLVDAMRRASADNRKAVREALASTRGFVGVTGTSTMGQDRNPETDVVIARIEGGRFRFHTHVRSVAGK